MLGYFDYTVWLTYLSLISGGLGIMVSLNGGGHPYLGIFFLLFCGLCDAFDGRVARTKMHRTEREKKYGIQIDSQSDLVAFGVLPACIGNAMIRVSPSLPEVPQFDSGQSRECTIIILFFVIILMYILAALVRLAYFNVIEEERQEKDRKQKVLSRTSCYISSADFSNRNVNPVHYRNRYYSGIFCSIIGYGSIICGEYQNSKAGLKRYFDSHWNWNG